MPWNSCLSGKSHVPVTDTAMTSGCVFGKGGRGAAGPPPAGRRLWRAFSPARASSAGPALRGKDTWARWGHPGALAADLCPGRSERVSWSGATDAILGPLACV